MPLEGGDLCFKKASFPSTLRKKDESCVLRETTRARAAEIARETQIRCVCVCACLRYTLTDAARQPVRQATTLRVNLRLQTTTTQRGGTAGGGEAALVSSTRPRGAPPVTSAVSSQPVITVTRVEVLQPGVAQGRYVLRVVDEAASELARTQESPVTTQPCFEQLAAIVPCTHEPHDKALALELWTVPNSSARREELAWRARVVRTSCH